MIDIIYHDGASAAPDQAAQSGGFAQADGNGEIHCYSWLDGVSAMLMRLEMESYTELRTQKGLLELNFCANGRFETRFSLRDHVLLKPGDMAISCYDGVHGSRSESHFPLGYYEGICLEVDPERARRWVERNAPAFRVDFSALQQNLLGDKWYRCSPAGPRCEHVFRELYECAAYLDPAFLRLKVLELLMLLSSIPRGAGTDAYCSARQAELIRHNAQKINDLIYMLNEFQSTDPVDGSDDIEMLDVSRTAGGIAQTFADYAGENRIAYRTAVGSGVLFPSVRNILMMIFNILLSNAFRRTEPGGEVSVSVGICSVPRPDGAASGAGEETSGAAERLRIEVSNRGVELDAGQIELIFDRYKLLNHLGALSR